jgi:hypothetical protein
MILHTRLLWFSSGFTISQRLIVIHPKYRDDKPLLAHERCHQQQMARVGTLTFWWRYLTDKAFRQQAEVEAYKVQISYGAKHSSCARHLSTGYWLNLDYNTAYNLLKD